MKMKNNRPVDPDRDTMRKEYDFSGAVQGVTAARYAQGANVVVIDPGVLEKYVTEERRSEIHKNYKKNQKEYKTGKLDFSGNIEDLKGMM